MVQLEGPCNVENLEKAIQIVVRRHEALHLRFCPDGSYQEKQVAKPLDIPHVDLSDLSESARDEALADVYKRIGTTPFDLVEGPIIRFEIVKCSNDHHVIATTCHHIVCDGWSWNVLLQEMGTVYEALCHGTTYRLDKAFPFSNYVMAELQRQTESAVQRSYDFWLEQFAELPSPVELPTDRPRPAIKSYAGATVTHYFRPQAYEAAKKGAAEQKVSLFAYLFSAFNLMLARLSGQNDVVVTVPAAGQLNVGQKALVGYCVNLLPARTKLDLSSNFAEFVTQGRTTILDAFDHQDSTYSGIVHRLELPRDLSRLPLSEINFNMDRDDAGVTFGDLRVKVAQTPKEAIFVDIFFNVNEHQGGLKVDCDFNRTIFEPETIQRWIETYEYLLEEVGANPEHPMGDISLLTADQRVQMLESWNQTQAEYSRDAALHHLFEKQAEQTPEATAILFEREDGTTQSISYRELNGRANQLARTLMQRGAKQDTLIGLCVERSVDMMVGLLGILKSGAGYVPMDPMFPEERLMQMVADATPITIITEGSLKDIFAGVETPLVLLDQEWQTISEASSENPNVSIDPEGLAYVIYTSGSTGKPKGVQIPHRAVVNFLGSMAKEPGLTESDTVLAVTTISFDIAVLELFLPLTVGARILLASQEMSLDADWLSRRLDQATVMQATPATWQMLLSAGWQGTDGLRVLVGGEALSRELADQLLNRSSELWNMYGPTETTIWSSCQRVVAAPSEEASSTVSIGQPIDNTQLFILDEQRRPVPIGVVGDLFIGGDGLARGYRNRPELTAEKFIANPFGEGRLYNTGDLARHRADGTIDFLGRSDFQVKIRGFRIELGEIESVLQQHGIIQEAVVVAREDSPGEKYLVGYLIANGTEPNIPELREYLRERLPEYMVPATFMFVEQMPLTPNGKVDRNALPMPDEIRSGLEANFVAPTTPLEQEIADIWSAAMGREQIGIHDNFFDLGGHSLQATRILARLRDAFNLELNLRTFFTYPTISGLAGEIGSMLVKDENEEEMLAMIQEVEGMSDDELQALLDE